MKYYKLTYDYDLDDQVGFLRFDEELLPFKRYDVDLRSRISHKEVFCVVESENVLEYDVWANNMGWIIVNEKVKRVFEECKIGLTDFIVVKRSDTNVLVGYIVHCMNFVNAFDKVHSQYHSFIVNIAGEDIEKYIVYKFAIDSSRVGSLDLFKLDNHLFHVFATSKLKKRIEIECIRGLKFRLIKSNN